MKTVKDIRDKWMESTGLPIVSDDEKLAYTNWLENEYLYALKNME